METSWDSGPGSPRGEQVRHRRGGGRRQLSRNLYRVRVAVQRGVGGRPDAGGRRVGGAGGPTGSGGPPSAVKPATGLGRATTRHSSPFTIGVSSTEHPGTTTLQAAPESTPRAGKETHGVPPATRSPDGAADVELEPPRPARGGPPTPPAAPSGSVRRSTPRRPPTARRAPLRPHRRTRSRGPPGPPRRPGPPGAHRHRRPRLPRRPDR